jgi:hypothetical protein
MTKPKLAFAAAVFAVAATLCPTTQASAQVAAGERIVARPLANDRITLPVISKRVESSDLNLNIVLNRAQDRVGGRVSVCGTVISVAPRRMRTCQEILFVFPGLRYDASRKAALLGDEIVARDRGFWGGGWRLEKGFSPEFRLVERSDDDGFEQTEGQSLELTLVRTATTGGALASRS